MNKTQEEHLCCDIRRIAQGIERIARAVEKTNDAEKVEVIRCRDCKYWRNHKRLFCADTDANFFCGLAERK
jgi:hypothetical protein